MLAAFDRVVDGGTPELVLVSGYSGIGKSSVVNELHKVLVPPRGLFASGKFDQYKRDIPYATLAQAFQSLIRPLLSKSDAELAAGATRLREALGPNGQLMVDLVPELELIIGEQPPVPELPPQDAQRRFQLVFRRFIGVFARPEHPLALFLDDLQWLDAAEPILPVRPSPTAHSRRGFHTPVCGTTAFIMASVTLVSETTASIIASVALRSLAHPLPMLPTTAAGGEPGRLTDGNGSTSAATTTTSGLERRR